MSAIVLRRVSPAHMVGGVLLLLAATAASAAGEELVVGDAYVRSEGATRWLIGTRCVEQVFECAGGQFRLVSYKNRCPQPAIEYVEANAACAPFALDVDALAGRRPAANDFSAWKLIRVKANAGEHGRPASRATRLCLAAREIRACFHVLAFPGTPILRQWVELENSGDQPAVLASPASACWRLRGDSAPSYRQSWIFGAAPGPTRANWSSLPSRRRIAASWRAKPRRNGCRGRPCTERTAPGTAGSWPWNTWAGGP